MSKIALSECHEETQSLNFRNVYRKRFQFLVMKEIHILHAYIIKIIFSLDAHSGDLDPLAVLDVTARCGYLTEINFRVEVCSKSISVIAAVAVQDIYSIDRVEFVLFRIGAVSLGYTGIEAAAQERSKTCLLELLLICPLPAVIEVSRKALFLASLLIDRTPFGIVCILRLVVCRIHIIDAADKACVHYRKILIRKCDIHYEIGLIGIDEVYEFINLVSIDLSCCDYSLSLALKCLSKRIALRLRTACNAKLREDIICLTAFSDRNICDTATSDN